MEQYRRVFWIFFSAAIPTASMLVTLLFQIKKVEVATANTEADLLLSRSARLRREISEAEGGASPPPVPGLSGNSSGAPRPGPPGAGSQ